MAETVHYSFTLRSL